MRRGSCAIRKVKHLPHRSDTWTSRKSSTRTRCLTLRAVFVRVWGTSQRLPSAFWMRPTTWMTTVSACWRRYRDSGVMENGAGGRGGWPMEGERIERSMGTSNVVAWNDYMLDRTLFDLLEARCCVVHSPLDWVGGLNTPYIRYKFLFFFAPSQYFPYAFTHRGFAEMRRIELGRTGICKLEVKVKDRWQLIAWRKRIYLWNWLVCQSSYFNVVRCFC